ncbi:MAG: hypothetical protein HYU69_11590 [Bacteroidetes bacterium]|nr:hypothetical protein [Bacteroidota bacterium]
MKQLSVLGVFVSITWMLFTVMYLPEELSTLAFIVFIGTPVYFLLFSIVAIKESFRKKSKNDYFL